ncbi:MAG TPA: hypothetical protein VK601_26250, partial [Kofleriaceae bacterium]|nr:hypothetical protein [Kofleriaceae bacterium]
LDGSAPSVLVPGQQGAQELALDQASVYWSNEIEGSVNRVAKRGGAPTALVRNQQRPYGVCVDTAYVYWLNYREGSTKRIAK